MGPKITHQFAAKIYFGDNGYEFVLKPTTDNQFVFADESTLLYTSRREVRLVPTYRGETQETQGRFRKMGNIRGSSHLKVGRLSLSRHKPSGRRSTPGTTSRVEHLEENVAAAELKVDANKMQDLNRVAHGS
jgi:hypothetical protein